MTQTVVITGASAGIGRATARLYGERGANVGLIARGQAGLDGAAAGVEDAGGKALAISADVADYAQVEDAARQVEEFFGPIDVWINVAFTSVFSPFAEISAEEFRRVTEVSYLGFVHGTMVALARMRPRGHGTIVQVGSALGSRSIPLQSAYCGAKHAINGFTSSLRCELLHEGSGVHVTVAQMPAADGVVFAADHPRRRQYWIGASTVATIMANKLVPALLDRYLARTGYDSQQTGERVDDSRPDNLFEPIDGPDGRDHGVHGIFDARSHAHSAQLWLAQRPRALAGAAAGAALVTGIVAARQAARR